MTTISAEAYAPYSSPEEYILGWTDRIWETRSIGSIRDHYGPDVKVHGSYGTIYGPEAVIRASLMKKAAFPTKSFAGEDVICEARGDGSFVSSHRIVQSGPMEGGPWLYGAPTLRESVSRNIATCLVRDALLVEEWVVRDEFAVVEQLGFDPEALARRLAFDDNASLLGSADPSSEVGSAPTAPLAEGVSGRRPATHSGEGEFIVDVIEQVWNRRLFDLASKVVHRDGICYSSRNRTATRVLGYQRELERLFAAVPDGRVEVHDVAIAESPFFGVRVGVVWRLHGTYCGLPVYGTPTASPVYILGSSHFLLRDGKIFREWRVYDELALLTQIVRARGDEPGR